MTELLRFLKDEQGATMVEYALMILLIALVCIGAVGILGTNVTGVYNTIANGL